VQHHKPIIAIDGPSGAGKSTLSKLVAKRLGFVNIDTGAMYRCVALASACAGIEVDDAPALAALCRQLEIRFVPNGDDERVILNGEDVSTAIRTPENSLRTSKVAAVPAVREALVALQRQMGSDGGVVLEGRDIGSVVFPHAEVKIFLVATAEERGRRRYEELRAKGERVDLQKTIAEVVERDRNDTAREHSPLVKTDDAVEIDTSGLSIGQVLQRILDAVVRVEECG